MAIFGKLDKSAARVNGMAERLGVDLAVAPGAESDAYLFRSMVLACSGCSDPEACDRLQAGTRHLDAAPAYCRNRARFGG